MCDCVDVPMGSYENQVVVANPFFSDGRLVGIDRCIYPAVKELWNAGIETVESCCGHNVAPPYIMTKTDFEALRG